MHKYGYRGLNTVGEKVSGTITALNDEKAKMLLSRVPVITELKDLGEVKKNILDRMTDKLLYKTRKVKKEELAGFLKRLSVLLKSGVSKQQSLEQLSQYGTPTMKDISYRLNNYVSNGETLDVAFREERVYFSRDYSDLIEAGESSGTLPVTLTRLADEIDADERLNKTIKSALAYPKILMGITVIAMFAIFGFILPNLLNMMGELMVGDPPKLTQAIMNLTEFMKRWGLLGLGVGATGLTIGAVIVNKYFAIQRDKVTLKIPIIGRIVRNRDMIRMMRNLGSLKIAQVSDSIALKKSIATVQNLYIQKQLRSCLRMVSQEGKTLTTALSFCEYVDDMDLQILDIGSKTGKLSEMLLSRADDISYDNDLLIKSATEKIGPIATGVMGSLILVIVISVYLPMYGMMGQTIK